EPNRLHEASHFLYTHLPNLVDLTNKYNEINDHEIKNKQTYEKLEESAQIIDQLSALIAQDYQKFVAEDLDDIDVEISVAKQSLKRDNKYEPEQKD
ncbi:5-bromo-4-chloroindolyl phosphate hydrolysis family protein, partial [Enterococcus sp. HMSC065H12]|uniref:5-bromo-4-chloroindolyl phosphate hydrolysis family protein n=1 Tax=Enterococcus sp. HMSC065H12 TaxID=1739425 RepID=UPI00159F61B9